jgi:hypothetical protein
MVHDGKPTSQKGPSACIVIIGDTGTWSTSDYRDTTPRGWCRPIGNVGALRPEIGAEIFHPGIVDERDHGLARHKPQSCRDIRAG